MTMTNWSFVELVWELLEFRVLDDSCGKAM